MRLLKGSLVIFAALVCMLVWWCLKAGPGTVWRVIYYNASDVDDYKYFAGRPLHASPAPFRFKESSDATRVPSTISYGGQTQVSLDLVLESSETLAFLVIKDDTIVYERYFDGYDRTTRSQAFSMSKSLLSILIGCAIDDGYIRSVNQTVVDFVPELADAGFDKVTIEHLLEMKSGMDYDENDVNPFGIHATFNYTGQLEREILKLTLSENPGSRFSYKSGDTALLGLILQRALKTQTITDYLQERLWTPLGMEYDGVFSIDHEQDGLERVWCCMAATARDFAKFGRLYLNGGNWNGAQIISSSWIERSVRPDPEVAARAALDDPMLPEMGMWSYSYQWWLVSAERGDYLGAGHLGQYLYVNPSKNVIIVRLGREGDNHAGWMALFTSLAENTR